MDSETEMPSCGQLFPSSVTASREPQWLSEEAWCYISVYMYVYIYIDRKLHYINC